MSEQRQNSAAQSQGPNPLAKDTGPALLRITFSNSAGATVGAPIEIRVPRELSKRLVGMYLLEMIVKLIKAQMTTLVSALGW